MPRLLKVHQKLQLLLLPKLEILLQVIQPKSIPLEDHQELQSDSVFTNFLSKVETHTLPSKCTEPKSQYQIFNINQLSSKQVLSLQKLQQLH
jgi:hypothetical protein